jgi:hypothetical protein
MYIFYYSGYVFLMLLYTVAAAPTLSEERYTFIYVNLRVTRILIRPHPYTKHIYVNYSLMNSK